MLQTDFYNNADNIRISGIRLDGADMGIASDGTPGSTGIVIYSSVNVEIDNNEIYGWHGTAVTIRDPRQRWPTAWQARTTCRRTSGSDQKRR